MGDQPAAIEQLVAGVERGDHHQCLLGATGTGKTFTMANVIARVQKPTLIISHNKTLAAQLFEEFRELFPDNSVNYFVSYYDYYQPEAYIPQRDIYIEKDASRNDDLDRLRLAATSSLISRRDVIVVASVSCIFGLGSPDAYKASVISLNVGQQINRQDFLRGLTTLQYERNNYDLKRGAFRVRGDVVELHQAGDEYALRIEFFGDEIERLQFIDPTTGELLADEQTVFVYPAVHYVMPEHQVERAVQTIQEELEMQIARFRNEAKLLEAERIKARTNYDLEMIREIGYCSGVENYSRHFDGRPAGSKPYTLLDYFPDAQSGEYLGDYLYRTPDNLHGDALNPSAPHPLDPSTPSDGWLMIVDESHVTLPQMRAMYHGDRMRKETLVGHGFRLPSALDNRPLKFEEIEKLWPQTIFVSATPGPYELEKTSGHVVEQIIRPTGLVDPQIEVRPAQGQVPDLLVEIQKRTAAGERSLVTTLTKRLAEDLARYLDGEGVRCRYMHSDIETLDRVTILRELREGAFDVLVGVNLLREGLDLPEVSFVAIMDADKTGFLRSATSMTQQIGRAARNVNAFVVLYADAVTPAMRQAMDETHRRREKQLAFNKEHGITPQTIKKAIRRGLEIELAATRTARKAMGARNEEQYDLSELITQLEKEMLEAAQHLEFEKAAMLRDKVKELKDAPQFAADGAAFTRDEAEPRIAPGTPGQRAGHKKKKRRS